MTLDEITALEYEWMARNPEHGGFEQRHALFQKIGMYEAWQRIFREYVVLARQGDLEALKRALFLYWYSWSEPNELSGILGLDQDLVKQVLRTVDDMAGENELDGELEWMLPYYYAVYSLYFDHRGLPRRKFRHLRKASQGDHSFWHRISTDPSSFERHGQLGEYWKSVQGSIRRWGPEGPPGPPPDWEPEGPWTDLLADL